MRARKLAAVLLAAGYLAGAYCRAACASSLPIVSAVEERESGCHDEKEPHHDSKTPCCLTVAGTDDALLPNGVLAPGSRFFSFFAMIPASAPTFAPSRQIVVGSDPDPPPGASKVLSLSSLAPRAPPAVVL